MKVKSLINLLSDLDQEVEVRIWSEDEDEYMSVTGAYHDSEGKVDLSCEIEP